MALLRGGLYDVHKKLGASFGEFSGWEVPMNYETVAYEHLIVRNEVGVFDITHMGRLIIEGEDSFRLLDHLIAKRLDKLSPGRSIMPTAMLNENGGFVDDITVYMFEKNKYLIVCNAVNREKVKNWIEKHKSGMNIRIRDITLETVMLAVQGPRSIELLKSIEKIGPELSSPGVFVKDIKVWDSELMMLSGGGWTGEKGFEIIADIENGEKIFRRLLSKGVRPIGIIARDTLRIEMGFVLYGNDINETTTPLEARYWVFSTKKKKYIGRESILQQIRNGVNKMRVGLIMKKAGPIPRHGTKVYMDGVEVGYVTSGTRSPVLNKNIAMAYVDSKHALFGFKGEVEIRNKKYEVRIVDFPFVST